jgi:HSP20 family protein
MAIVKWSPLKELEDMRRDMDRLFDEFFTTTRRRRGWPARTEGGAIVPNIDMYERKNEMVLKVELPGVSRDSIDLTITKDSIMVKGEVKKDEEGQRNMTDLGQTIAWLGKTIQQSPDRVSGPVYSEPSP